MRHPCRAAAVRSRLADDRGRVGERQIGLGCCTKTRSAWRESAIGCRGVPPEAGRRGGEAGQGVQGKGQGVRARWELMEPRESKEHSCCCFLTKTGPDCLDARLLPCGPRVPRSVCVSLVRLFVPNMARRGQTLGPFPTLRAPKRGPNARSAPNAVCPRRLGVSRSPSAGDDRARPRSPPNPSTSPEPRRRAGFSAIPVAIINLPISS